tara:strand:- start:48 stop:668 length:621 start_codon:yes stop_codon:yes gene_type:complete
MCGIKISPINKNIDVTIEINELNNNSNDNLSKKCNICYENYNSIEELYNCGNKKCSYFMCEKCIQRLNILPIENKKKCPACRLEMSNEIINKLNKNKDTNSGISDNLSSTNNNLNYFKNILNKIIKIIIKFYKFCWSQFILIMFATSLLLFLGNMTLIRLNIYINIISPLFSYLINGFLGGLFIVVMIIIFLFLIINLYRCIKKFC